MLLNAHQTLLVHSYITIVQTGSDCIVKQRKQSFIGQGNINCCELLAIKSDTECKILHHFNLIVLHCFTALAVSNWFSC